MSIIHIHWYDLSTLNRRLISFSMEYEYWSCICWTFMLFGRPCASTKLWISLLKFYVMFISKSWCSFHFFLSPLLHACVSLVITWVPFTQISSLMHVCHRIKQAWSKVTRSSGVSLTTDLQHLAHHFPSSVITTSPFSSTSSSPLSAHQWHPLYTSSFPHFINSPVLSLVRFVPHVHVRGLLLFLLLCLDSFYPCS